jgi:hypothetical protein
MLYTPYSIDQSVGKLNFMAKPAAAKSGNKEKKPKRSPMEMHPATRWLMVLAFVLAADTSLFLLPWGSVPFYGIFGFAWEMSIGFLRFLTLWVWLMVLRNCLYMVLPAVRRWFPDAAVPRME